MFEYSQEELLEKIEKAIHETAQSKSKETAQQSVFLHRFLVDLKKVVKENKNIRVENISREITNSLNINRPKWIDELKSDNSQLEKKLSSVVQAIEIKEVVREVDIKESLWLKKALKQTKPDIPKGKDYSKLLTDILKEVKKEIKIPKEMNIKGTADVNVKNKIDIQKPAWYKTESTIPVLSSILSALKKPLSVKLQTPIKLEKEILDVKVKDKVEMYVKDGKGRIIDFDRQFGRIGGGRGGSTGGVTEMKIIAEDINNTGTFVAVQGQYNATGHFELLTAGSGSTPTGDVYGTGTYGTATYS